MCCSSAPVRRAWPVRSNSPGSPRPTPPSGELNIGVLEKAGSLGEHNLSGAVVNPRALRELFPDLKDSDFPFRQPVTRESVYLLSAEKATGIPTPPPMKNHGNYTASICELVRWLGEKAEGLGVNIFPGFPAEALLVEDQRVIGVRTTPSGLDREGNPGSGFTPPTDLTAKVTVLTEGTRGHLGQAWRQWQGVTSPNPQIFALGVKENMGGEAATRPDHPYAGLAAPEGRLRGDLHVPSRRRISSPSASS